MNSKKRNILFTGGGGAASSALSQLLSDENEVHFCDANPLARHPLIASQFFHTVPLADSSAFVSSVYEITKKHNIDVVVPAVDEELLKLTSADFGDCTVMLPDKDYVLNHTDKEISNRVLETSGISVPKTLRADLNPDLIFDTLGFPFILKPKAGRGSRGVRVVHNRQQFDFIVEMQEVELKNYIVQQLILGDEYTVTMSANSLADLKAIVPVKIIEKRGITIKAEITKNEFISEYCRNIHNSVPAKGVYNIQLILPSHGSPMCFEINPRMSTTSCFAMAAGVNFITNYFDSESSFSESYNENLTLTRFYLNEFRERS